jgi:hypothetical protein
MGNECCEGEVNSCEQQFVRNERTTVILRGSRKTYKRQIPKFISRVTDTTNPAVRISRPTLSKDFSTPIGIKIESRTLYDTMTIKDLSDHKPTSSVLIQVS